MKADLLVAKSELSAQFCTRLDALISQEDWEFPSSLPVLARASSEDEKSGARDRMGKFRLGYLEERSPARDDCEHRIVFVPGFLTNDEDLKAWELGLRQQELPSHTSLHVYHWPSKEKLEALKILGVAVSTGVAGLAGAVGRKAVEKALKKLPAVVGTGPLAPMVGVLFGVLSVLGIGMDAAKFIRLWKDALAGADFNGSVLAGLVLSDDYAGRTTLVGHSLGGRLVLKAAETLGELSSIEGYGAAEGVEGTVALAPALVASEIELQTALAGSGGDGRLEVFFSGSDWLLKGVFRLGRLASEPALGGVGLPEVECPEDLKGLKGIDVTAVQGCPKLGHTDYSSNIAAVLGKSQLWREVVSRE